MKAPKTQMIMTPKGPSKGISPVVPTQLKGAIGK